MFEISQRDMIKYILNYINSIKYFILLSFIIFLFAVLFGYFFAQFSPQEAERIFEELKEIYEPIQDLGYAGEFFYVVLNNSIALFITFLLGLFFGLFSTFSVFSNGAIIGILMYLFIQNGSTGYFFLGIVPHGIVEIPALIIASAMGLRVGLEVFRKIFKKEGNISEELSNALEFFWKVVIPIIFLAALIEVFITANLLGV